MNADGWRRFFDCRTAVAGLLYLAVLLVGMAAVHFFVAHSSTAVSDNQLSPPSIEHWFGTDYNGRDLLTRTAFGLRISIFVGVCGAIVSLMIGTVWGSVAAWFGGWIDAALMRTVDILYAMPSILFVIVLMAGYDGIFDSKVQSLLQSLFEEDMSEISGYFRLFLLYLGLGAVSWLTVARIVRGEVLALKQRTYILASRILGGSSVHILRRHILPNLTGTLIVYLTLTVPTVILYESFLSYLGLGIKPPFASVGSLIAEGAQQINPVRISWWVILFPAGALVTTLMAFNFIGDGLREVFNLSQSATKRR